jgi:porin
MHHISNSEQSASQIMSKMSIQTAILSFAILVSHAAAQDSSTATQSVATPGFGGPGAVENQMADDEVSFDGWRNNLKEDHGFSFSVDYTGVVLSANETFTDSTGAGGIARAYGTWDLWNEGAGALIWKFEHRHAYGDTSPFDFSMGQMGYVGLQEPPFNDSDFRTQNLYWRQRLNGGRSTLIAGILDVTDYVDAFALASPWLHFMNFGFSTGSAAIGLPNDAAVGVAYGSMLTDNIYVIAGITDTNGDPSNPFEGFDNFFRDNEYFTSVEIGWTSSHERIILDNTHLTIWHKDRQVELDVNSGWGAAFSYSQYLNDNFMPFVRGAYADDGGTLLQKSLSVGLGYRTRAFSGLLGLGLNWGEPNEDTFGPGLSDQFAIEAFYRVPLGKRVAITADTQFIKDPALNPDESTLLMLNVRARFVF